MYRHRLASYEPISSLYRADQRNIRIIYQVVLKHIINEWIKDMENPIQKYKKWIDKGYKKTCSSLHLLDENMCY